MSFDFLHDLEVCNTSIFLGQALLSGLIRMFAVYNPLGYFCVHWYALWSHLQSLLEPQYSIPNG
jgi:hypothetical protein